jgi:tetratricopeptide (TPR) repeat protein
VVTALAAPIATLDHRGPAGTDFAAELRRLDDKIATHRDAALVPPTDTERVTTYVDACYRRALLTGDLEALGRVELLIDRGITLIPHPGDLWLLKARLAFHLHRLADVAHILDTVAPGRNSAEGQTLLADLDVQHGRVGDAAARYEAVIGKHRSWAALAGLAWLQFKFGDSARADRLYAEAADELTAKEMRAFAWLELQRGVLDLAHGRSEEAERHYARAGRAYSGWWLVDEHRAELLAHQGNLAEAIALYEAIAAERPELRPELHQALGQLYLLTERPGRARSHFVRARAGYVDSVRHGGVHYFHHLADFYSEAMVDGARAVDWARRDLALRENFSTQAALAWALLRAGEVPEAAQWMDRALACGVKDAHLYAQASAVYQAGGNQAQASRCLALARAINPRPSSFHVHR